MRNGDHDRLKAVEAWWPLVSRVIAFFLGVAIVVFQLVSQGEERLWMLAVAVTLMGPAVASVFADILTRLVELADAIRGSRS